MKKLLYFIIYCLQLYTLSEARYAQINVVTTSTDLASIVQEIGKHKVRVQSLATGKQNLHYLSARPDFILKANKAQLFVLVGLDLEVGWVPLILQKARNSKIQKGEVGYCDASKHVPTLEKPTGEINRSMGDMHIHGNPHYWTDPVMGVLIANNIKNSLIKVDPLNKKFYKKNFIIFKNKSKKLLAKLKKIMKPHKNKKVLAYHREYVYMENRFNFQILEHIEEKPGVAPSPNRMKFIKKLIQKNRIKVVLSTPWNPSSFLKKLRAETGVKILVLPIQTGAGKNTGTYLQMLETCIKLLDKYLK